MMKGFVKNGKWMGLALIMAGLLFAGCVGGPSDSSEEPAVTSDTQTSAGQVPMKFEDGQIYIGPEGAGAAFQIDGRDVELVNGGACTAKADGAICPIDLINRDTDEMMNNTYVSSNSCIGCVSAEYFNADVTVSGGAVIDLGSGEAGADGDVGEIGPINDGGFCYAEDGDFVGAGTYWNDTGCDPSLW